MTIHCVIENEILHGEFLQDLIQVYLEEASNRISLICLQIKQTIFIERIVTMRQERRLSFDIKSSYVLNQTGIHSLSSICLYLLPQCAKHRLRMRRNDFN